MNVLITHERSGIVSAAFRALGHRAFSCDIAPLEFGHTQAMLSFHLNCDALIAMRDGCPMEDGPNGPWHIIIMHPECTYTNGAGIHWNNRGRGWAKTEEALNHVRSCMLTASVYARKGWGLENPVGLIGTRIRPADQWIQPYMFGDDASKRTGLWLHGLPLLDTLGKWVDPRWVCSECGHVSTEEYAAVWRDMDGVSRCPRHQEGLPKLRPRWANQTDSGQNRLGPSETRSADRARTYPGIAKAMAEQWGALKP